jgi:hypothetical protein
MNKLEKFLEQPFDKYMEACWNHVREKALIDPIMAIVYAEMLSNPAAMESAWARRYWFHKNGAYNNE